MKGVILAGGLGTRLYPLTHVTNKHLLPVYDRPMIHYPLTTLSNAGITDILIVVSGPHVGHFLGVLKNGKDVGVKHLEYAYQEKPDGGIADALSLARDFADGEPIAVMLGDNTTDADISNAVQSFSGGAKIFLKEVEDPERFGIAVLDEQKKIVSIEEKPKDPKSNMAITGLYIYDQNVFDHIKQITPSGRGQLEITDVNKKYLEMDQLHWAELKGFWSDAGTFDSLFLANSFWARKAGVKI
jgi:glucose-1-phosphate thymidylyltransferase